jgi:hypothetical protein
MEERKTRIIEKNMKKFVSVGVAVLAGSSAIGAEGSNAELLPIKEIIMYSSGTALFERSGEVAGQGNIELKFKTEDINDLLKSMVVQGGAVTGVTYDSRDPVTRTLRSFGVDLTDNPSMGALLNQMRGEQVKVFWPNPASGTILGVEKREQTLKTGSEERTTEVEYLNLLGEEGLSSIPLAQVQKIQMDNKDLEGELKQALQVLARAHDTQKKSVTITFTGDEKKDVRVTYIAEAPVWKTSYRLVVDEKEPYLQGWAIVENTSDEDWQNVRLSLVSGRPISFVMDLYQPMYAQRPIVQPELFASLRPQVYRDAMEVERLEERGLALPAEEAKSRMGFRGGTPPAAPAPVAAASAAKRMSAESFGRGFAGVAGDTALQRGDRLAMIQSVGAAAEGGVSGELFEYAIRTPVTVPRQKSAMLPIVGQKVSGEKLSIYNQNVQAKHPLNGYRLKNTTDLHLMQGPITVFDSGSYAGDAQIEDLAPGQDRLLSYALDSKVEVEPVSQTKPWELVSVRIQQGTFYATKRLSEEKTYNIRNRDQKEKRVLIEHPLRADWELENPTATERTRDVYRFARTVAADKSDKLVVAEHKNVIEEAYLTTLHPGSFGFYISSPKVSDAVKAALKKVQGYQQRLNELGEERKRYDTRTTEISQEQSRIRENMGKLNQNSELYLRYVKKFDEQETELEKLRKEIERVKDLEAGVNKELSNYLSKLDLK